jgi:hypothetical protein
VVSAEASRRSGKAFLNQNIPTPPRAISDVFIRFCHLSVSDFPAQNNKNVAVTYFLF